ncbi:hypothetical protein AtNW77_Chr5g0087801 [Arabidopsis thaliana]
MEEEGVGGNAIYGERRESWWGQVMCLFNFGIFFYLLLIFHFFLVSYLKCFYLFSLKS